MESMDIVESGVYSHAEIIPTPAVAGPEGWEPWG